MPHSMPLYLQAIEAFQKDPPTTVFLLSMRSGAVGIRPAVWLRMVKRIL